MHFNSTIEFLKFSYGFLFWCAPLRFSASPSGHPCGKFLGHHCFYNRRYCWNEMTAIQFHQWQWDSHQSLTKPTIVDCVCLSSHDSLPHPNLPNLGHVVLPWCPHVLPSLFHQCSPSVLPCHAVSPYYLYMKGELYRDYLLYLSIHPKSSSETSRLPVLWSTSPLMISHSWSPARVAWQEST